MKITALAYAMAVVAIGNVSGCGSDGFVAAPDRSFIRLVQGDNVASIAGLRLPIQSIVLLHTAAGAPIPNVNVLWTVTSGGGSLMGQDTPDHDISGTVISVPSDSRGFSAVVWILGGTIGGQTMTASVNGFSGSPVEFTAIGTPP